MEDDDAISIGSRSSCSPGLNSKIDSSLLYCDEDPLVSTTPPPSPSPSSSPDPASSSSSSVATVLVQQYDEEEGHDQLLMNELLVDHMARQRFYAPTRGYLEHLLTPSPPQQQPAAAAAAMIPQHGVTSSSVSGARSRGVHYIIYAFGRLGLTAVVTVFNAVNYLDRFLSINCHLCWETWMVELVSVACLSIACKLDEVNIPSLHDLQMEEMMSHSFLPATVRDMELTLLKALQWRLACVTPYSFLQLLLPLTRSTTTAANSRCTRLLIRSLQEPSMVKFDSSVIASSALRCVALEDHQTYYISCSYLNRLLIIGPDFQKDKDNADECFRMMETLYASCSDSNTHHQLYSHEQLWSPVSVTHPLQTQQTGSGRINSRSSAISRRRRRRRRLLFGASSVTQGSTEDDDTHTR